MARLWSSLKNAFRNRSLKYTPMKRSETEALTATFRRAFEPDDIPWEDRRPADWPTANDVPSVCRILGPFFDELEPESVVYVHGSFSRGLETARSDINLYIPSHRRATLEDMWLECKLRRPSYETPRLGETIEVYLRDLLGKEVSVCFSDDPWSWVEHDVKVRVYPSLDEDWVQPRGAFVDARAQALQMARKCWYTVRQFEIDEAWKWRAFDQTNASVGSNQSETKQGGGKDRTWNLTRTINKISNFLDKIEQMDWRTVSPELSTAIAAAPAIHALRNECDKVFFVRRNESPGLWEKLATRFRRQTVAIESLGEAVFP